MLDNIDDEEKSYYQYRRNIYIGQDSKQGSYLNYCQNHLRFDNDNSSNNLLCSPMPPYLNIQKDSSNNISNNNNIFRQQPNELGHSSNLIFKHRSQEKISYRSSEISNGENKYLIDNGSLDGNQNNYNGSYYKDFLQKVFGEEHHLKRSINFQNGENKDKNKNLKKYKNKIRSRPQKLFSMNYEESKNNNNNLFLSKDRYSIKMKNKRKLSSVINVDKVNNTGTNCNNNYKQTVSTGNNKQSNKNLLVKNYSDKKRSNVNSLNKKRTTGGADSPRSQLNDNDANEYNNFHFHKVKFRNKTLGRNKKSKKKISKCLIKDDENTVKDLSLRKISNNNKELKSSSNNLKNNEINGKEKEKEKEKDKEKANINVKDIKTNCDGNNVKNGKEKSNKKKKNKKGFFSFCTCCC